MITLNLTPNDIECEAKIEQLQELDLEKISIKEDKAFNSHGIGGFLTAYSASPRGMVMSCFRLINGKKGGLLVIGKRCFYLSIEDIERVKEYGESVRKHGGYNEGVYISQCDECDWRGIPAPVWGKTGIFRKKVITETKCPRCSCAVTKTWNPNSSTDTK